MTDSLMSGHRPYHAARISRMPHRRELKLNFKKKLSTEPGALLVDMPEFTEHVQSCALLCGDIMQRVVANDITFLNAFKPTEPLPAFVNKRARHGRGGLGPSTSYLFTSDCIQTRPRAVGM